MSRVFRCLSAGAFCFFVGRAQAADIEVIYPSALQPAFAVLIPSFEQKTHQKIDLRHAGIGEIDRTVRGGRDVDVVISAKKQLGNLIRDQKAVAGTEKALAAGDLGMALATGARPIDAATTDKFDALMRSTKSLTYVDPKTGSAVGAYLTQLFQKRGLSDALRRKTILAPTAAALFEAVRSGEAQIGIAQKSEIVAASGVKLAGELPSSLQQVTRFDAAVATASRRRKAAEELIAFLASPGSASVFKAKGLGL